MVEKTQLSKESIEEILINYDIGKYKDFSLVKKGSVHSNYVLITEKGKFILRIFEERNGKQILLEMKLLEKLSKADIPTPNVIKTLKNDFLIKMNGKNVAIFTFLDGTHIENENNLTLKQIEDVGKYMGRFHKVLNNFEPKEVKSKYNYNHNCVKSLLVDVKKDLPDFPSDYEKYIYEILDSIVLPNDLPQGLNHGDLHADNVLFEGNKVSGIIDFDDCFYGNLLSDVGCGITFWCIEKEIDFERCKCFLNAYEKERKLTFKEKEYLYEQSQLFMLIHLLYWWCLKENWNKEIKPLNVLKALRGISKKEFIQKLF